jgi:fermentation-respiration switch protein FrsA (DUF1100 family)
MGLILLYIAGALVIAYCGWALVLYFLQASFLYQPVRDVLDTPSKLGLDFESVLFKTSDGLLLTGWYIPADKSELTILFCQGNGGNVMHRLASINIFHNLGLNCFIFDYRGYGSSQGRPSEEGTYLDAAAAYKWLTGRRNVSPDNIIIFGRSLGGSIAAHLAASFRARALVIESAFTSYVDMGKRFFPYMPVRWFARFSYRTIRYIKYVRCPVMVIHSRDDKVVPLEFGQRLYEAAHEPKEFVRIVGSHNDGFLLSKAVYTKAWQDWLRFLKEHEAQPVAARPVSDIQNTQPKSVSHRPGFTHAKES